MSTCVNCQSEVLGNYCSNCGQRNGVKRLTFREGWNDFWARIYGFDGMFPRTLIDLTLRPGKATRKVISGNRVAYYGPVGYFFLMITLMYLVASLLGIDVVDFMKNSANSGLQGPPPKPGSGQEKFMSELLRLLSDNLKLLSFLLVPILAFGARFVFFRKSGFNFLEHSILFFYTQGHVYWLSIISLLSFGMFGKFLPAWIVMVVSIVYSCYATSDMYHYQSKIKAMLKGLSLYLMAQLIFIILMIIAVTTYIILNPEAFELVRPSNNR